MEDPSKGDRWGLEREEEKMEKASFSSTNSFPHLSTENARVQA